METSANEKLDDWTTKLLGAAVQEILDKGITKNALIEAKLVWCLPFQILVGKIRDHGDETRFWWFITGDLPTDYVDSSAAASAREAARYFALRWQIRAANDAEAGSMLAKRAESLYELTEDDRLWAVK